MDFNSPDDIARIRVRETPGPRWTRANRRAARRPTTHARARGGARAGPAETERCVDRDATRTRAEEPPAPRQPQVPANAVHAGHAAERARARRTRGRTRTRPGAGCSSRRARGETGRHLRRHRGLEPTPHRRRRPGRRGDCATTGATRDPTGAHRRRLHQPAPSSSRLRSPGKPDRAAPTPTTNPGPQRAKPLKQPSRTLHHVPGGRWTRSPSNPCSTFVL